MKPKIQNYEHTSDEQSNDERNRPYSTVRLFDCSVARMFVILLGCFLCPLPTAYCQLSKVDSLLTLLKTAKEDTNKVNTLNALAWELKYNNPDTAIVLSTQALKLAKKQDWQNGIGQSYHQLGVFRK